MRRFRFSLEALLQVKTNQLEVLEAEIYQMEMEQNARRHRLTELSEDLVSLEEERLASILRGVAGEELFFWHNSWVSMFTLIQLQHRAIEEGEAFLETKRQEHLELNNELKMLKEMKERAQGRWQQAVLAEEQKILDEFATQRYVRSHREI